MAVNDSRMLEPAQFCAYALATIEASEGRRKRRRRDTTPDAIGLNLKREILQRAIADRPAPTAFEAWLMTQIATAPAGGPVHAICREILEEYRFATGDAQFRAWLAAGAPSADASAARDEDTTSKEPDDSDAGSADAPRR